ncbi:MAG: o-succinylbenzoate synthase [Raineya sp.]|nr:o-succinylbenzoate synthase [Raineya sp.]MDW8296919.1 o-succinylbenzoate synthase [Raineya sp.]
MQNLRATFEAYTLRFRFEAGTSRGILKEKKNYFIRIFDAQNPDLQGVGEVNILKGLSLDDRADLEVKLTEILQKYENRTLQVSDLDDFPAIRFALETAEKDLQNGGNGIVFPSPFTEGKTFIPINGLIWMGSREWMLSQIQEKIEKGFTCLKMKIGALDFETELEILRQIRKQFPSPQEMILRVDANGAFLPQEALEKLKKLAELHIHSIEQPIAPRQIETLAWLCENSPVPIALDEELIGNSHQKENLLQTIRPQFIVLKPALLGGFAECEQWIQLAQKWQIGWWITSALESSIGLSAIAQWTATLPITGHQGLGTGQIYENNFPAKLRLEGEKLWFNSTINP